MTKRANTAARDADCSSITTIMNTAFLLATDPAHHEFIQSFIARRHLKGFGATSGSLSPIVSLVLN